MEAYITKEKNIYFERNIQYGIHIWIWIWIHQHSNRAIYEVAASIHARHRITFSCIVLSWVYPVSSPHQSLLRSVSSYALLKSHFPLESHLCHSPTSCHSHHRKVIASKVIATTGMQRKAKIYVQLDFPLSSRLIFKIAYSITAVVFQLESIQKSVPLFSPHSLLTLSLTFSSFANGISYYPGIKTGNMRIVFEFSIFLASHKQSLMRFSQ